MVRPHLTLTRLRGVVTETASLKTSTTDVGVSNYKRTGRQLKRFKNLPLLLRPSSPPVYLTPILLLKLDPVRPPPFTPIAFRGEIDMEQENNARSPCVKDQRWWRGQVVTSQEGVRVHPSCGTPLSEWHIAASAKRTPPPARPPCPLITWPNHRQMDKIGRALSTSGAVPVRTGGGQSGRHCPCSLHPPPPLSPVAVVL